MAASDAEGSRRRFGVFGDPEQYVECKTPAIRSVCSECQRSFVSRNRLFAHLKKEHDFERPKACFPTAREKRDRQKERRQRRHADYKKERRVRETKERIQSLDVPKGCVPIKAKFVIKKSSPYRSTNADGVAVKKAKIEDDDTKKKSSHRNRGQNKSKARRGNLGILHRKKARDICSFVASGKECRWGAKCRNRHDVANYLSSKGADVGPVCVHFENYGSCPFGFNCRFGKNHFVRDEEAPHGYRLTQCSSAVAGYDKLDITNLLTDDLRKSLMKKRYNFPSHLVHRTAATSNERRDVVSVSGQTEADPIAIATKSSDAHPASSGVGSLSFKSERPIKWEKKIVVAPLTTVGNLPFRRIVKCFGADVTVSEMALASSLLSGSASEWALLKRHKTEDIFGVQIAGCEPKVIGRAVNLIARECNVSFVDINCGCPIDPVVRKGMGSALMTKQARLEKCVIASWEGLVDAKRYRSTVPEFTLKMRTGYFDGGRNADKICGRLLNLQRRCQALHPLARISNVTVHGRTREQRYYKLGDLDYVKRCVSAQVVAKDANPTLAKRIPILYNGDVYSFTDWERNLEDGVLSSCMIGRGALVKPWLPTEIKERRHWDISASERFDILKDYCRFGLEHWGSDAIGISKTRRFLLEWLSFLCRYIPVGVLERVPMRINEAPSSAFVGRNDMETLLSSSNVKDWVKISEMLLGPVPDDYTFLPKHRSSGTLT